MLQSADSATFDSPTVALDGAAHDGDGIGAFAPGLNAPVAASQPAEPAVAAPTAPVGAIEDETVDPNAASDEIDARRSRQLLDRALHLAERGEISGAILACRQSIALSPALVSGYSMLGMLLERSGDVRSAVLAYERVLQLAPNSALERDSLARLRDKLDQQGSADIFSFDDGEVQTEARPIVPLPPVNKPAPPVQAAAPSKSDRRGGDRRKVQIPVAVERRRRPERRAERTPIASNAAGTRVSRPAPPPVAGAHSKLITSPLMAAEFEARRQKPLQALLSNPTYYWKGVPLACCTLGGLLFLVWARGHAPDTGQPTTAVVAAPTAAAVTTVAEPTAANDNSGANQTVTRPPAAGATAAPGRPAVAANPAPASRPAPRVQPVPPAALPAPAPASAAPSISAPSAPAAAGPTAAPASSRSGGDGGASVGPMTPPKIQAPPPAEEPVRVLPPDSGAGAGGAASSSNGTPLNPAGSPARGYIRVSPNRIPASAPVRPTNAARGDESRAAAAAQNGQPDAAIAGLTNAINNSDPNEVGYRYQQRAMLFKDRGDYSRAVDDFQSAISAYNDQIARGEQTAAARAGLKSARSGLNSALSARRSG